MRFDTQLLQNPEIAGTQYQRGTLAGWEARAYLLVKYAYQCAYCSKADTPFEVDHILPRSRGGSNRISNLCLACHACNQEKGDKTAAEFGHPEVEAQAKRPLKDAAAVNATWFKVVEALRVFGLPIGTWTGVDEVEPGTVRSREDPCPRCLVRRRSGGRQARQA